jgi:hypothetical protein
MSAPAEGPPPPPPPPLGNHFERLPAELLLYIIRYLNNNDLVRFALAYYPVLLQHRLLPPLDVASYRRIVGPRPTYQSPTLWSLPVELREEIMRYLEPADRISFLLSKRELLGDYLPVLSQATRRRLWNWMGRPLL